MFGVVSLVALVGLLSLCVPVVIHLINPGKGKIVWVGNIHLLKQAKKHQVNEYRIEQWPLLLLRILLLIILTLILAGAYFNGVIPALVQNHVVASKDWLAGSNGSIEVDHIIDDKHIWQQLAALDLSLPKGDTIDVYVTDKLSAYDSPSKPKIGRQLNWHISSGDKPDGNDETGLKPRRLTVYAHQPNQLLANALNAIKSTRLPELDVRWAAPDTQEPSFSDWLIYLPDGQISPAIKQQVAQGAVLLRVTQDHTIKPWGAGVIAGVSLDQQVDFANRLFDKLTTTLSPDERFSLGKLSADEIAMSLSQPEQNNQTTSLRKWLWSLLVLLFLFERYWAERLGKDHEPG